MYTKNGNTGAIYVFENTCWQDPNDNCFKLKAVGGRKVDGDDERQNDATQLAPDGKLTNGARYGHALLNLGRLNEDKYEDFAVGAPYEAGSGAVYLYLGRRNFWENDGLNKGN